MDSVVGLMVTSKRVYAKGDLPKQLLPVTQSLGEPLATHSSTGDPPALAGSFGSVSYGVTAPFPWVLLCSRCCLCPLRLELLFPQSCGSLMIKSHWPSRSDSLGIPSPFVGSPGWGAWYGVPNLYNSGRTSLVLLFSSLWITHQMGMGFDFIMIVPLLLSCCSFFFVFERGLSFSGRFQWSPFGGYSTTSCDFGAFAGGDEHTSFLLCHLEPEVTFVCLLVTFVTNLVICSPNNFLSTVYQALLYMLRIHQKLKQRPVSSWIN